MKRVILGLTGPIGSGKTTAANALKELGFRRIRFAGVLKDMLYAVGMTEPELDGNLKETPCAMLGGKTPRYAMQTLGTEWGRHMIDPNFWVNAWRRIVEQVPIYTPIVADDVRFENEVQIIRHLGGKVAFIKREGCEWGNHASERFAFTPDVEIVNNQPIEFFYNRIIELGLDLKKIGEIP